MTVGIRGCTAWLGEVIEEGEAVAPAAYCALEAGHRGVHVHPRAELAAVIADNNGVETVAALRVYECSSEEASR